MYIKKIKIQNFRLLYNTELSLEHGITLIIGRNNSGKTSLTELFRRISHNGMQKFSLVDFSICIHDHFWEALNMFQQNEEIEDIRQIIPKINVEFHVEYDNDTNDPSILDDFIIDLDDDLNIVKIILEYRLMDGYINNFLEIAGKNIGKIDEMDDNEINESKRIFFQKLNRRKIIEHFFKLYVIAKDPSDENNIIELDWNKFNSILDCNIISAQRGLDDKSLVDSNRLGKVLTKLLDSAKKDEYNEEQQEIIENLESAVKEIQNDIDSDFKTSLEKLLPSISSFGYPGLIDPQIITETYLNAEKLMKNHTKVCYLGKNGLNLPEKYNGLGVRNLLLILFELYSFSRKIQAKDDSIGLCVVFIEEPEVHLHPQMQEVFIRQISEFEKIFNMDSKKLQYIITTHSSHIANEAPFSTMKYFLTRTIEENLCKSDIKDLKIWLEQNPQHSQFLHKYMTLTKCDLLFADKAILVEGTSERILLPLIINKLEQKYPDMKKLSSQYITKIEVGGHHAHVFFELLNFLDIKTLIITDIDSVGIESDISSHSKKTSKKTTKKTSKKTSKKTTKKKKKTACLVSKGTHTSNSCLKNWFNNNISPRELIDKSDEVKIKGIIRVAYQVPEIRNGICGRSFEEAFILKNTSLFEIKNRTKEKKEKEISEIAKKNQNKKADFAIKYAITETNWDIPKYIEDGLKWLAE